MMISVLYYGGTLVADSSITIGALTSFLLYAAYIGVSIGGLTSFYSELNKGIGAAERLWEIMDRQPLLTDNGIITIYTKLCKRTLTILLTYFRYNTREENSWKYKIFQLIIFLSYSTTTKCVQRFFFKSPCWKSYSIGMKTA